MGQWKIYSHILHHFFIIYIEYKNRIFRPGVINNDCDYLLGNTLAQKYVPLQLLNWWVQQFFGLHNSKIVDCKKSSSDRSIDKAKKRKEKKLQRHDCSQDKNSSS